MVDGLNTVIGQNALKSVGLGRRNAIGRVTTQLLSMVATLALETQLTQAPVIQGSSVQVTIHNMFSTVLYLKIHLELTCKNLSQRKCVYTVLIVNGQWSVWGDFNRCNVTCGGGKMERTRNCDNPPPQHYGLECVGSEIDYVDCNTEACPGDGKYHLKL